MLKDVYRRAIVKLAQRRSALIRRGAQMQTVMVRLFVFSTEQTVNADAMMRSVVFSMIPPIILFFIFQKQLTENAVSVGIKG